MRARVLIVSAALLQLSCGPPADPERSPEPPAVEAPAAASEPPGAPPVEDALLAAPNDDFAAVEPSEIGVQGASNLDDALAPLTGDAHTENGSLQESVRESGDMATADIVRMGLDDDAVSGAHIRVEFRREPDGWFPTNAYRRFQCARGALAGQWSVNPCP